MKKDISTVSGRRHKSESVDIRQTINFDLPSRDPGRIPSLPRPLVKTIPRPPITRVPPKDMKKKVEQELATASSKRPPRPIPPSKLPQTQSEEQPKPLSELLDL